MPISFEEKNEFAFKVALKLAEKENLLPLSELWRLKANLSTRDLQTAEDILKPVLKKSLDGSQVRYQDLEASLYNAGYSAKAACHVIAILYADGNTDLADLVDKLALPDDLTQMLDHLRKSPNLGATDY